MKLLIATHSQGKKKEYASLLDGLGLELLTLTDLGIVDAVEESGATYAENALLKGRAYAASARLLTLADDSGLEVDALGGVPGVLSARYAGAQANDADRYGLLLANLRDVSDEQRTARFRCVIALVWPDGRTEIVEGVCEGRIAHEPRGEHGFGYDPVFYLPELGKTMAELPAHIKNRISHRARAAAAARDILLRNLSDTAEPHKVDQP